jgi:hypothetical protein
MYWKCDRYWMKALTRIIFSSRQRKHLFRWLSSFDPDYFIRNRSPWIPFDAFDFIQGWTARPARVFEYGSGGSTLYWMKYGVSCVSIEHDPIWYDRIRKEFKGFPELDYRLIMPDHLHAASSVLDPADPAEYSSSDAHYGHHSFYRYVTQIDEFPDGFFDLVFIDGRARPSCFMHARTKVSTGGWLILDNADRTYYLEKIPNWWKNLESYTFSGVTPATTEWISTLFIRIK